MKKVKWKVERSKKVSTINARASCECWHGYVVDVDKRRWECRACQCRDTVPRELWRRERERAKCAKIEVEVELKIKESDDDDDVVVDNGSSPSGTG